jgi:hypothetical protein
MLGTNSLESAIGIKKGKGLQDKRDRWVPKKCAAFVTALFSAKYCCILIGDRIKEPSPPVPGENPIFISAPANRNSRSPAAHLDLQAQSLRRFGTPAGVGGR